MSYRSFKHLLGETSLERKCRFIFGLGILLLVSVSFFLYGKKTEELVRMQTTQNARAHVDDALNKYHTKLLFEQRLRVRHQRDLGRVRVARRSAQVQGSRPQHFQCQRRPETTSR